MSVRATHWAWETARAQGFGGNKLLVLLRAADHADNDGVCWPGEKGIADFVGVSARRVRDNLDWLEQNGLITRERRPAESGRGRRTDLIKLQLDQPDVSSSRSAATNRTLATGPTGRFDHDQPDAGDAAYIEEPSGTVIEPSPLTPQGGIDFPTKPAGNRSRDLVGYRMEIEEVIERVRAELFPDVELAFVANAAKVLILSRGQVTAHKIAARIERYRGTAEDGVAEWAAEFMPDTDPELVAWAVPTIAQRAEPITAEAVADLLEATQPLRQEVA